MFSNGEIGYATIVILTGIGLVVFVYSLDRICKCVEKCKLITMLNKHLDKNNTNDINETITEDDLDNVFNALKFKKGSEK